MLLVGPAQSELSVDLPTPASDLADLPLILTTHPNSLRRMVEVRLHEEGRRPNVRIQANTLPLMTDLVARGLGHTVLPSCSALRAVKDHGLKASPLPGMRITWTVARPLNRPPSVAARRLLETVFATVHDLVATGAWPLAELEADCSLAVKRANVVYGLA